MFRGRIAAEWQARKKAEITPPFMQVICRRDYSLFSSASGNFGVNTVALLSIRVTSNWSIR